jgi:hypothetical protein
MTVVWRRVARHRIMIAFVALTIVSCTGDYLSFKANQREAYERCIGGGEFRLVVAEGFDELRRDAVAGAPKRQITAFVRRTQPAIDRVLSQTADRPFRVPLPSGRLTPKVERQVAELTAARCERQ